VETVYLALGSNLGDRAANLRQAREALAPHFIVQVISPVYETEPAYLLDQPRFYNQVLRAATNLDPLAALHRLKSIEAGLGRTAGTRFGPRLIDLDLLLYGSAQAATPELTLPHPRLAERPFVLVPLADIAPDLTHPVSGETIASLRDRLGDTSRAIWPAPPEANS
jgi:2-amino-4-hydroxy-6-hydroxymethyldihydropteridine diphosphokinase